MSKCICRACGEEFKSVSGFDMHRVGNFSLGNRRCLTEKEMLKLGMIKKNEAWITSEKPVSAWTAKHTAK